MFFTNSTKLTFTNISYSKLSTRSSKIYESKIKTLVSAFMNFYFEKNLKIDQLLLEIFAGIAQGRTKYKHSIKMKAIYIAAQQLMLNVGNTELMPTMRYLSYI